MLDFELPLVRGNVTVVDAIKETIESNTSGLLFEVKPGELRLVHAYSLLQAAANNQNLLKSVVFDPVTDTEALPDAQMVVHVENANRRFGFRGLSGLHMARVFSISEFFGSPYTGGSPGRRCTRPGRPETTPPTQWFHYPPENHDPEDLDHCAVCEFPLQ